MRVDHRFFTVNDLRLHAIDFGGEGRPIILLHGAAGHGWLWTDVAGQLTLWGKVMAVDLRGHGDSQWSASGAYRSVDLADDVAGIIEQLGGSADVVGLSWGGLVAMRLADHHPALVRRLAVLDIPTSFESGAGDVPLCPYEFDSHREVLAWERNANPAASPRLLELLADQGVRPSAAGRLARKHDPYFATSWPFRDEHFETDWAALIAPTLLVRAGSSDVLAAERFDAMLAAQPLATGVTIPDSGHLLPVDRPVQLADALESFLHEEALDAAFIGFEREMLETP